METADGEKCFHSFAVAIMEVLEKILAAAIELFGQYGFKTITMDDIARRAGVSKKTLYQHFANKAEVVRDSVNWYKHQTTESCMGALMNAGNAVEAMVKILAFFDGEYKQMNPMALFELQRFFPESFKEFKALLMERDVQLMKENILQGKAEGVYRAEINADLMARYRIETALMAMQPSLLVNDRASLMNVALEIGEHFMYGIMTPKGITLYEEYKLQYLNNTTVSTI
jgi:AcrR family transcriptional regulator